MINVYELGKPGRVQVTLGKSGSFFFLKRLPIGFRYPDDLRIMVIEDKYRNTEMQGFIGELLHMCSGRLVTRKKDEFNAEIKQAYEKALLLETRRIGLEQMNIEKTREGTKDVKPQPDK